MRSGQKIDFARQLRHRMTDAERALWHHLRNRALMGCKFRRQHPVGPYVVDFACVERRLVVELDGGQHAGPCGDGARTRYLRANGYRVLRFWNNDALREQEAVLAMIYDALQPGTLTPTPLPQAGEGLEMKLPTPLPQAGEGLGMKPPTPLPRAGEGLGMKLPTLLPQAGEGLEMKLPTPLPQAGEGLDAED